MNHIPRTPLILGLLGLIPFVFGAAEVVFGTAGLAEGIGLQILLHYGTVILAFMSGVLWGLAATGKGWNLGYILSVIPALWAFFSTLLDVPTRIIALALGFAAILVLDWVYRHIAPRWWLHLRLILTSVVLLCLGLTSFYM